jgi:predicted nucleic acid-binding protein
MIEVNSSVAVKWFKPGERFKAEALDLLKRIDQGTAEAAANEIVGLEIVRALKNAQTRFPALAITDTRIEQAYARIEKLFTSGVLLEC